MNVYVCIHMHPCVYIHIELQLYNIKYIPYMKLSIKILRRRLDWVSKITVSWVFKQYVCTHTYTCSGYTTGRVPTPLQSGTIFT